MNSILRKGGGRGLRGPGSTNAGGISWGLLLHDPKQIVRLVANCAQVSILQETGHDGTQSLLRLATPQMHLCCMGLVLQMVVHLPCNAGMPAHSCTPQGTAARLLGAFLHIVLNHPSQWGHACPQC